MAVILKVANTYFDAAGTSRLEYNGGNTINLVANGGGLTITQNTVQPKQGNTLSIGTASVPVANVYIASNRTIDLGSNVKLKHTTTGGSSGLQFTGAGEYYEFPGFLHSSNGSSMLIAPTTQLFTANGTWSKPTGCKKIKVSIIGGGGGGGGASYSSGQAFGGGGSGGCMSIKWLDVSSWSNTTTVTIGAGGTGGSSSGGTGGNGGTSSFGTHVTAAGGDGGIGMTGGSSNIMAAGGSNWDQNISTSGNINVGSAGGGWGCRIDSTHGSSGSGGQDFFGREAPGSLQNDGENWDGVYGGGGAGASTSSGSSTAGGAGGSGLVMVEEFY